MNKDLALAIHVVSWTQSSPTESKPHAHSGLESAVLVTKYSETIKKGRETRIEWDKKRKSCNSDLVQTSIGNDPQKIIPYIFGVMASNTGVVWAGLVCISLPETTSEFFMWFSKHRKGLAFDAISDVGCRTPRRPLIHREESVRILL